MCGRETEVIGEILSNASLATTDPTLDLPVSNPGHRSGEPASSLLSYRTLKPFLI
jgi:hypothetical protein